MQGKEEEHTGDCFNISRILDPEYPNSGVVYQEQQRLFTKHIDGNKNVADMFTKPLTSPIFRKYWD